jgi:hypothetical protein
MIQPVADSAMYSRTRSLEQMGIPTLSKNQVANLDYFHNADSWNMQKKQTVGEFFGVQFGKIHNFCINFGNSLPAAKARPAATLSDYRSKTHIHMQISTNYIERALVYLGIWSM